MFDIAPSELLLVVIVAIIVIGPKDLPLALRTAGRWLGEVPARVRPLPHWYRNHDPRGGNGGDGAQSGRNRTPRSWPRTRARSC